MTNTLDLGNFREWTLIFTPMIYTRLFLRRMVQLFGDAGALSLKPETKCTQASRCVDNDIIAHKFSSLYFMNVYI